MLLSFILSANLRMKKTIATLLLSAFFFLTGYAQFNDSTHYHFHYIGTGSLNKTDAANAYLLSNNVNFIISRPTVAFTSATNYTYGQQNHLLTNNDFSSIANLDFGKGKKAIYYWGLVNYQTSHSLNINYKLQGGAGFGFSVLDSPKTNLSISDGFLYEANNLVDATLGHDVYSTLRNSFRLRYKFVIRNIITFSGTDFVQPSLLSINDYIINFNNTVAIQLRKWLSLNSAFNYNRINRTRRENLLLTFGIGIDKYF